MDRPAATLEPTGETTAAAPDSPALQVLEYVEWSALQRRHAEIIDPWIEAFRDRRARRLTHPIHDFLFTYYQTNRRTLSQWRPSARMRLAGEAARIFLEDPRYIIHDSDRIGLDCSQVDEGARRRLQWARLLMRSGLSRPPRFNCFGLHEWAMVYRADEIRHESTPLRLSPAAIAETVERNAVRCSHFDAYRFFTPEAAPLNEIKPTSHDREAWEQFGCVHFNMDLYRWSYKLHPWIGSDLMRDCFLLAARARELDMRASPYDLSSFGYDPIPIETTTGRETYRREQEQIYRAGQPLAHRLLSEIDYVLDSKA